jgi:hypothetical protein
VSGQSLEATLAAVDPNEWEVEQIIVLGWYDGPTMGLCKLRHPECSFRFEILGQRFDADVDDRLFRLAAVPASAVDDALDALSDHVDPPRSPVWVPLWKFHTPQAQQRADQQIESILRRAVATPIIVRSRDLIHFLGLWLDVSDLLGTVQFLEEA